MRGATAIAALLAALAGCGGRAAGPAPAPPPAAVAERLGPFEWLVGRWLREDGGAVEQWSVARGALIGVGISGDGARTRGFEVMIVRVADGRATFTAMPNGAVGVDFPEADKTATSVTFENPAHDFPRTVRYALEAPDVLVASLAGDGEAAETQRFTAAPPVRAPALEAQEAELAGADGARFAAAFDPRGAMWREDTGRVVGREAIREALAAASRDRAFRLARTVTASGMSPAGDLGYTIGPSHASVWRKQPDGSWLLAYDSTL